MTGRKLIISALLLALVQIGFLGWMIAGRAAILRDGREVLLKVEPVDPRDLLRGDYVLLGYEISRIPVSLIANLPAGGKIASGLSLVVRLKQDADGYWRPVSAWLDKAASAAGPDEVDIVGRIPAGWDPAGVATVAPDYGIERFYLPEGEGKAIEKDMRVRPFGIRAAIAKDGTAQIKALMDGDKTLFSEPLF
jgi:uncharacterized membrane-anchored protein